MAIAFLFLLLPFVLKRPGNWLSVEKRSELVEEILKRSWPFLLLELTPPFLLCSSRSSWSHTRGEERSAPPTSTLPISLLLLSLLRFRPTLLSSAPILGCRYSIPILVSGLLSLVSFRPPVLQLVFSTWVPWDDRVLSGTACFFTECWERTENTTKSLNTQ